MVGMQTARMAAQKKVDGFGRRRRTINIDTWHSFAKPFELGLILATPSITTNLNVHTSVTEMASKKDMRRVDLVIPYVEPPAEKESDFSSTFSSTMPMAAVCSDLKAFNSTVLIIF
jgi:hypothetical protein